MKSRVIYLLFAAAASLLVACNQGSRNQNSNQMNTAIGDNSNLKLQIYYFHATHRCPTCNSIETNVKQVLESNFKDEMEKGIISFISLNVEDEQNKALAEKYQAAGAALHLVEIENGIENDNNLTGYAFSYSRKQPELFMQGMKDTIEYYINH